MKTTRQTLGAILLGSIAILPLVCPGPVRAQSPKQEIHVAYQTTFSPWVAAVAAKKFEKQTGHTIEWRKFNSGADVITAMASGNIDIGVLGSSPLAVALSAGMDMKLFWILEDIASAEALLIRNGTGIHKPQDLAGKTIAVPTASTSAFQLAYVLKKWGISDKVHVINLSPEQAAAAWQLGRIDGAFIWGPSLSTIKKTGYPLITAGEICKLGRCTFEGLVANGTFAASHAKLLKTFVQIIDAENQDFLKHPDNWKEHSKPVQDIARLLGGTPQDILDNMRQYRYPTIREQASCQWLGCGKDGGAAKALVYTAQFLKEQKRIDKVLPGYAQGVTAEFLPQQ